MWYAAVSQTNSAAYLLMFFLSSLVMVSAIHAHFALTGVALRVGRIEPVFAGELASIPVEVLNLAPRPKIDLVVAPNGHVFRELAHVRVPGVPVAGSVGVDVTVPTFARGKLAIGRLALTTDYPMGFFRSWKYEATDAVCLVYPKCAGKLPLPLGAPVTADTVAGHGGAGDDFMGVRAYQAGESQRHVDWRAVARGQPYLVKQFSGAGTRRLWLEWADTAPLPDLEARLSQFSRWIVDAEVAGLAYGLRIPGFEAEPSRGKAHYARCLGALAVYEEPGE
jgi:uncharacterized protein (DUF58 family)